MSEEEYFYVDVFPAEAGDCFMVRAAGNGNKTNILIDGGFTDTYQYLSFYIKQNKIKTIDLLVVTHIDRDHINGIIKFIFENSISEENKVEIKEIWFNGLRHLKIAESDLKLTDTEKTEKSKRIIQGIRIENFDSGIHNIGGKQGSTLSAYLRFYGYENIWNKSFGGQPIAIDFLKDTEIKIGCINIKLLSPTLEKLNNLKDAWIEHLKEKNIIANQAEFDDEYEIYLKSLKNLPKSELTNISSLGFDIEKLSQFDEVDTSLANGSSIAFILKYENTQALFLGDAHNGLIENELKKLKAEDRKFRLVKLSHHGSNWNIGSLQNSNDLLNLIEANEFLISANGDHGHPNLETIAKIIKKNTGKNYFLTCNYITNPNFKNFKLEKISKEEENPQIFKLDKIYKDNVMIKLNAAKRIFPIDLLKEIGE